MTDSEKILVENELVRAIATFHDCDDKEKRERYVREYFLEFCEKHNINQDEALEEIEKFLEDRRENSIFKYEHYKDLKSIIYPKSPETKDKASSLEDDEGR